VQIGQYSGRLPLQRGHKFCFHNSDTIMSLCAFQDDWKTYRVANASIS
jgi:hypothetical protein